MRKAVVALGILFFGCEASNKAEAIDTILLEPSFTIQHYTTGDGGEGYDYIRVIKKPQGYYAVHMRPVNGELKSIDISWPAEKNGVVRNLFLKGIALKNDSLVCKPMSTYVLKSFPDKVTFDDSNCVLSEEYTNLLETLDQQP